MGSNTPVSYAPMTKTPMLPTMALAYFQQTPPIHQTTRLESIETCGINALSTFPFRLCAREAKGRAKCAPRWWTQDSSQEKITQVAQRENGHDNHQKSISSKRRKKKERLKHDLNPPSTHPSNSSSMETGKEVATQHSSSKVTTGRKQHQ
jgi:hypothetical protein